MNTLTLNLQENQNIKSNQNILEIYNSNQNLIKEITPEMDSKTMAQIVSERLIEVVQQELNVSSIH